VGEFVDFEMYALMEVCAWSWISPDLHRSWKVGGVATHIIKWGRENAGLQRRI